MTRRFRRAATAALLACTAMLAGGVPLAHAQTGAPSVAGYQPSGVDERGLWMEMDEAERELKTSQFVIRDAALNDYVRKVLCRTVGQDRCGAARIYIVRTPFFNASMAPNGMMQVWTGLLLRVQNEAQLAAVLGHEFAHFEKRHSLQNFRSIRAKTDAAAWLSFLPFGSLASLGILSSIFQFNRDMETEADLESVRYLAEAGYLPDSAPKIWTQFGAEADATAVERQRKSRKDRNGGFFASHPNSTARVAYLSRSAGLVQNPASFTGNDEYRAAMVAWWAPLIDDQIKLNDFGATNFLITNLASGGWTGELLYARGELHRARGKPEDFGLAATYYRQSVDGGFTLPEARRGLGLALLRSGQNDEGKAMLKEYVRMRPDAPDRSMMIMLAGGE